MKLFRRLFLVLLSLLVCLSLCGCRQLDEMKAKHAVWRKDGTILWNGTVYRPLPRRNFDLNGNRFTESINVTESDVPVLLSEDYGERFYGTEDGVFLYGYKSDEEYTNHTREYCRADKYKEVRAEFDQMERLEGLCYDYYDQADHTHKTYYLTVEQQQSLYNIMEYGYSSQILSSDNVYSVDLYWHDPYDLYRQSAFTLMSTGYAFYIMEGPPYSESWEWGWLVSDDYKTIIDNIIRVGYEAENARESVSFYE